MRKNWREGERPVRYTEGPKSNSVVFLEVIKTTLEYLSDAYWVAKLNNICISIRSCFKTNSSSAAMRLSGKFEDGLLYKRLMQKRTYLLNQQYEPTSGAIYFEN